MSIESSNLIEQRAVTILESYSGANNYILKLKHNKEIMNIHIQILKKSKPIISIRPYPLIIELCAT
jgi:hypothetical protein